MKTETTMNIPAKFGYCKSRVKSHQLFLLTQPISNAFSIGQATRY